VCSSDPTTTQINRLNDNANVTLNRANLTMQGNATLASNETFGTLTNNGHSVIAINPGNAAVTGAGSNLTTTNLVRNNNSTLFITASGLGAAPGANVGSWTITNNPGGTIGGILPYAAANSSTTSTTIPNNTFVRYDTSTQRMTGLNLNTDYQGGPLPVFLNSSAGAQYRQTFTQAGLTGTRTINSLLLDTSGAAAQFVMNGLTGPGTLNVTSGAILSSTFGGAAAGTIPNTIGVSTLNFGSNTGYFHTPSGIVVTSVITGSGGIARAGGGALSLFADNTFTGDVYNHFGNIVFDRDANLGAASNNVRLFGGTTGLFFLAQPTYTNGATMSLTTARNIIIGDAGSSINVSVANTVMTATGTISGTGLLAKTGAGTLVLNPTSGSNTFSGRLQMASGVTMVASDAAMGAAGNAIEFIGTSTTGGLGVLQPMTSFSTNRNILTNMTGSTAGTGAIFFTNGNNLQLDGVIGTQNQQTGQTITKVGTGDLILTNTNTYNGATAVGTALGAAGGGVVPSAGATGTQTGGRLVMQGANGSAALSTGLTVNPGSTLMLDNSAAVNNFRVGMVAQTHVGSELSLMGNATDGANTTQAIGTYTSSTLGNTVTLNQPASASGNNVSTLQMVSYATTNTPTTFFRGNNLGGGAGDRTAVVFNTSPALTTSGILASGVGANTPNGSPTGFVTVVGGALQMFGGYLANNPNAGANQVTDIFTAAGGVLTVPSTVSAARISGAGSVDLAGNAWTISDGHIVSTVAGGTTISNTGAAAAVTLGTNARITNTTDLTLGTNVTVTGTTLTKFGTGTLLLNQGGSTPTTWNVAQGSLRYGTGVANALPTTAAVTIGANATLDLNNNTGVTLASVAGFGTANVGTGGLTLGTNNTVFMGALQGSGAITMNGANTFVVSGNNGGFSGNWNVNAGTLQTGSNTALGSGTIFLGNTTGSTAALLNVPANGGATTISNNIVVNNGSTGTMGLFTTVSATNMSVNLSGSLTINKVTGTSGLTLGGAFSSTALQSGANTLSGNISGPGSILYDSGNWNFYGNNSGWSGGLTISAGNALVIGLGTDTALGTGPVTYSSTSFGLTMRADNGARTLSNPVSIVAATSIFSVTGTNDLTLSGPLTLATAGGAHAISVSNMGTTTLSGAIGSASATATFSKNGFGDLVLSGPSTFAGGFTLNSGALGLGRDTVGSPTITSGPVGTGTFTINAAGSNGAVLRATGGARTVNNPTTINGDFVVDGSNDLTLGGAMNLGTTVKTIAVANTGLTTFAGVMSGAGGGITKAGAGTLVLATGVTHNYTGATNVIGGALRVNGTLDNTGTTVTVGNNAANTGMLSGTGIINRPVSAISGGTIKPGASPGVLTVNNTVTMATGSIFAGDIQGTTPGNGTNNHAQLIVTGGLTLNSPTLNLTFAGYTPTATDQIEFVRYTGGTLTGTFNGLPDGAIAYSNVLSSGIDYRIWYGSIPAFGSSIVLSPVPEPFHILLMCGGVTVGVRWWRRRTKASVS